MATSNPYQQYAQNKVFTATPGELTLMLYEGILKFCKRAKVAIEQKNIREANDALIRSQNIIRELKYTLKQEYEVGKQLAQLYDFMLNQLIEANIKKEAKLVDEVLGLAQELHDTWKEAIKLERQQRKQA
ncbi:flagellar export chaperone FliS [Desulfuribacillus stibiiarsenatis]|uniref:Flagellar secretion chaperone FliS n=1 Tax=Desulfuribacillus stibiiarsenatis TaxID=1390249 RepID=A0A1E5L9C8_9FIRM|nr:flagellar export chaperone FliS [Desulfuribacillus stibiiarsenatis]OEH86767.1 flagellar export chaperone FliS [Desulfuribacillus stibiiarsenatis]